MIGENLALKNDICHENQSHWQDLRNLYTSGGGELIREDQDLK